MSVYKNGKLIAGGRQCMPLLSFMWADHILNDASWLRADTFSWQSGAVYQAAYAHLVLDIDGKTLQSETISGTTVQFYLADDGHKICPASEESNVSAIYAATGVAWYYILDTANTRFKLPRINPDKAMLIADSIPVVTGSRHANTGGALTWKDGNNNDYGGGGGAYLRVNNSVSEFANMGNYQPTLANNVKPDNLYADSSSATSYYKGNKYLYFYVGNFTQTALENTAGINTELFNDKADITAVAGLAAPDYFNITSLSNLDSYQQIQEDGYLFVNGAGGGNWNTIGIHISTNGTTSTLQITQANMYATKFIIPISKGVYIKRYDSHVTAIQFIPCKGNN